MGGISRCETVYWRGRLVCKHSVPKLDKWAASTGSAIYVKPIQGCYSTSVSASVGTHARGGVYDVEMDGYTLTQANYATNQGRKALLITFLRWWKNSDGSSNHHIHLLDPECPDLSAEAVDQVEQFRKGETGLVGADKDTWDRSTAAAMLWLFDHRFSAPATSAPTSYTIPSGGTLAKAAVVLGTTVALLAGYNGISNPDVVQPGQVVKSPPSTYTVPVKPAPSSTVRPPVASKPPVRVVVTPKPVRRVSVAYSHGFRPLKGQRVVYRAYLKPGKGGSTSVYLFERALSRRGYLPARYAADGYYGTATKAAVRAMYRDLARKHRNAGWTPNASVPGPALLRILGLKSVR